MDLEGFCYFFITVYRDELRKRIKLPLPFELDDVHSLLSEGTIGKCKLYIKGYICIITTSVNILVCMVTNNHPCPQAPPSEFGGY